MTILGIETSTMTGSIALMDEERLIAEYTLNLRETHSSRLMPAIDRILKDASLTIKDLNGIAVSLGPGSFTGLRIGIATAKGLAQGLDIPIVGIPTLDGLAFNLSHCKDLICPILDARKGEVYCALYKNGKRLTKYMACELGELLKKVKSKVRSPKSKVVFLGDGIEICGELIKKRLGKKAIFISKSRRLPNASSIAELGLKKFPPKADQPLAEKRSKKSELPTLRPIYVRAPVGK
ncbi:tRNA (adenosine(37)-N6)-threonylcarbamoyltransferase complex dimerization subunit type 1 TsaB [bacterium]|nr:tRNA (adenosine(37)-N6)-threonylcarbamoyltransferase complex dimerization subunit type 1 TsaB [bacterium]MBU4560964.1 tRNA (adenosine(37)-N6)-threonylcarbamoyltransferase complex dimerization subunit type 1 TsaB [bacterium]MCG2675804.1 tRNA (adenosine(37)-N6)-threonylcarbamoyltransferase complex dimerization subunit type 1 TsaB [bacterium]